MALKVNAAEGLLDARLAPAVDWTAFSILETLGIDEAALLKGHGHDMAVIWARDADGQNHVLAVLPDRLRVTVRAFPEMIPDALKATVRRVCRDLREGHAGAVAAALPKAHVVVDRFHMAVHDREAVDTLRPAECRRLNADRPPERAIPTAALRPLLRREWPSLNPDQQGKVVELFEQTPLGQCLCAAHPADGDLQADSRSGHRPNPTPALDRAGQGIRSALL